MEFIKTQKDDLSKVIILIEKTKHGCVKKEYTSLLDMPEFERNVYIAQAFANVAENMSNTEEVWQRMHIESLLAAKFAKTVNKNQR